MVVKAHRCGHVDPEQASRRLSGCVVHDSRTPPADRSHEDRLQQQEDHDTNDQPVDLDVLVALRKISERQRAVIHLTYWEDLTTGDIASLLGLSVRTTERELTLARRRLEALLS